MKCYLCLTEPNEQEAEYLDTLYVSLKSAKQNTSLDLYVLYDGSETGRCYSILKQFDVHIIKHKFSHKQYLEKTYPQEYIKQICGHEISYDKISGAFMRFDIPFVEQTDDFVFYADIDVMFLRDFSHENFGNVEYLAASAEFEKNLDTMKYFNSGILYLNINNMKQISNEVFNMLKNGTRSTTNIYDQGYLNQLCFDKMTVMPLEFNWKPYWGYNKDAYIIHFHGMKPGGNIKNSGFSMCADVLHYVLKDHWTDINGYVYYLMQYYELLGKDGKSWIADFISLNFTTIIDKLQNQYIKKYKSYKKRYIILGITFALITITLLLIIILTSIN